MHESERELGLHHQLQPLAAEADEGRREARRGPHSVDVHVREPCRRIVSTETHEFESLGIISTLLKRPSRDRAQSDVGVHPTLKKPSLAPTTVLDDPWSAICELARKATCEHIGRLDEMIVHREHEESAAALNWVWKESEVPFIGGSRLSVRIHSGAPTLVIRVIIQLHSAPSRYQSP